MQLTEHQPTQFRCSQVGTSTRATNERVVQLGRLVAGQFSTVREQVGLTVCRGGRSNAKEEATGGYEYVSRPVSTTEDRRSR